MQRLAISFKAHIEEILVISNVSCIMSRVSYVMNIVGHERTISGRHRSGSISHGVNILDIIIFSTTPIHSNIYVMYVEYSQLVLYNWDEKPIRHMYIHYIQHNWLVVRKPKHTCMATCITICTSCVNKSKNTSYLTHPNILNHHLSHVLHTFYRACLSMPQPAH